MNLSIEERDETGRGDPAGFFYHWSFILEA
jgi:hypothetical protein